MPLSKVLESVTLTHPEILEAQRQYNSIIAERTVAKSGFMPVVSTELTGGQEITDGVASNHVRENLTTSSATLLARQNIYNGGRTLAAYHETDARVLAAAYQVLTVANRVYLSTIETYLNVLKAREMLELSRENVLTQEKILEQVREKTVSGFTRISDLKNSEARLALARSNYISRQQDLNQAVVAFHRQMGRFVDPKDFVRPTPTYRFPETVEDTVTIAFKTHPALDVAKYNIQMRKFSYEKAKGNYRPTVDLELKVQHRSNTGGDEGYTKQSSAMVKFNYTIFDGGLRKGQKLMNYEQLRKENQRSYVERRNVNESTRLAWNILQAEDHKKKYLSDYVEMSATTLEAFKEEYHIGRRTLLDLLNMENEYNSAKNSKTESEYVYLTAYYRIAQATGVLLQEYDTGIHQNLDLPLKKFHLLGYNELDSNRDMDSVEDISDQCDNSIMGVAAMPWGCSRDNIISVGYREPTELSPYILPEEGTPEELDLKIDKRKETQSISLDSIRFRHNSGELTDDTRQKLTYVAKQLKATHDFEIEVIGHTDSNGTAAYNRKLSRKRAQSVYKELIRLGVARESLSWSGKGEAEPIADNKTREGRNKNRRTEFKLTRKRAK